MAETNPGRGKSRVGLPAVGATQMAGSNPGRGKSRARLTAVFNTVGSRCRAKRLGNGTHVECLDPPPHGCDFAAPTGTGTLCIHPKRLDIAMRCADELQGGAQM